MKTWMIHSLAVTLTTAAIAMQAAAQQLPAPKSALQPVRKIVISLEDRKLALIADGQVMKIYTVAVGKPSTPSPEGTFTIERRVANPVYHHGGRTVEPGPSNPVGTRWMGLSTKGYGIHGTNEPKSIGKAASHGCIRMAKADLEEIYAMVEVGDQVQIVGTSNDLTARLFAPAPSAPATQSVQIVAAEPAAATPATAQQPVPQPVQQPVQPATVTAGSR